MKKLIAALLSCVLVLSVFTSCGGSNNESPVSSSESVPVTTTTATTTAVSKDELYAKLAQLTKEDGTGEINLQMNKDEIAEVLEKYGIDYTVREMGIYIDDHACYDTDTWGGYGSFDMGQSYKGLKIGDSVMKVLELYGEPDEVGSSGSFKYVMAISKADYDFPIIFSVHLSSSQVTGMSVYIEFDYAKIK